MSKSQIETTINTGTTIGSQFSQVVGVTVSDEFITLEFAFINPRDTTKGQVVSRVTLPLNVGLDLAKAILNTKSIHDKRKKGEQND